MTSPTDWPPAIAPHLAVMEKVEEQVLRRELSRAIREIAELKVDLISAGQTNHQLRQELARHSEKRSWPKRLGWKS